ncbi:MAG: Programmed cell death toxin YdcE, partial [uncultured Rubrobacteraceae bacterium]
GGRRLQPLARRHRERVRADVEPAPDERAGQRPDRGGRGEPHQKERRGRVAGLFGREGPSRGADRVAVRRAGGADPGRSPVPTGIAPGAV